MEYTEGTDALKRERMGEGRKRKRYSDKDGSKIKEGKCHDCEGLYSLLKTQRQNVLTTDKDQKSHNFTLKTGFILTLPCCWTVMIIA